MKAHELAAGYARAAAILPCGGALVFRRGVKRAWNADASPRVELDFKAAYSGGVRLVCPGCEADARECPALKAAAFGIDLCRFAVSVQKEMRRDHGDGFTAGVANLQDQGARDLDAARRGDQAAADDWPVFEIVHLDKLEAEADAVANDCADEGERADRATDDADKAADKPDPVGNGLKGRIHAADSTAANGARQGAAGGRS